MPDSRMVPVPDGLEGLRLDVAISRLFGLSRTAAADLIDDGAVSVDGSMPARSSKVVAGSWLEITIPDPVDLSTAPAQAVDGLVVLYDDADVVVVDKPVGVAAHPTIGWDGPTVVQGLAAMGYRISTSGAPERQGVVHRLDAGTTGVMVVAKSEIAYTVLKRAFKERTVEKLYSALVQGHPDPTSGTIDAPLGRHPSSEWKFAVVADGRDSVTHYETVQAYRAATLLDVHLETGRTHQIRVHLAAMRHPCCGDALYGADPVLSRHLGLTRQWLHARELGFDHPTSGERVRVVSPFPADLQRALDVLEAEA
ncbi:RluA family pseudouridine synthase [Jatrophihabitans telluris]|uniref:Pseudouridine synthase n=1 Tax=Jatrophihabitans telluris TaxID=2038343 RepID=A0ABY4QVQ2_9ACTN|nr:RluA family pseudouridine synthase [Jatrophihabitans telluris]UQX87177.1 RluA family pseudouridine synthase [Jatrophihabitans telluris]